MASKNCVTYYRVSTDRQGRSGLGLAAQRKEVADYINGGNWQLLNEFTEVESGKSDKNRPQLAAALALCRKHKATLIIAKLDRLSRNAGFLMTLRDGNVDVRACDMPEAGTLEFGIRAVVAQHEREEISRRTKAALAAAKARGTVLGITGKDRGAENKAKAQRVADDMRETIQAMTADSPSLKTLTARINAAGIRSPQGAAWHATSVRRLLQRQA